MAKLAQKGIEALLPSGFEGTIYQRKPTPGAETHSVAQFATFPLPAGIGDFGGGATPLMRPDDIFAVLFEFGPESLGKALFARHGLPRMLAATDFHPYLLRRGVNDQAGTQWFFTEADRPFTLYAVLGSYARRTALVPRVNDVLGGIRISPLPAASVSSGG